MIIFVLDADGLIKLTKSGMMQELSKYRKCIITKEVFDETVRAGKERLYEDAYIVEDMINKKLISVETVDFEEIERLGKGEASSLALFKKKKCSAIITDDRKFLSVLEEREVPFMLPADVIIRLLEKRKITREKASEALENLKPFIRKDVYTKARNELG